MRPFALLLACGFLVLQLLAPAVAKEVQRQFTAQDSIQWTRLLPFSGPDADSSAPILSSPDGNLFLVHTRTGNLQDNTNSEALLVFSMSAISRYLDRADAPKPKPRILARLPVSHDWGAISNVQWLSSSVVAFCAEAENHTKQAFVVNVQDRKVKQLTSAEGSVGAFAVLAGEVLYYGHERPGQPLAQVLNEKTLYDTVAPDDPTASPLRIFQMSRTTRTVKPVIAPAFTLAESFRGIWPSPDGRYAVILGPTVNAPPHWADYQFPNYALFGYSSEKRESDPTSFKLLLRTRYRLVDLQANSVRDLLDAPTGYLSLNGTPQSAFWLPDGNSVIVTNTLLPLEGEDSVSRARRTRTPAIAEISVKTGAIHPITFEPPAQLDVAVAAVEKIEALKWDQDNSLLTVVYALANGKRRAESFQKVAGRWLALEQQDVAPQRSAIRIQLSQALNERPRLTASGTKCRCTKSLFDPNPQADRFSWGQVEFAQWRDSNNIDWEGALLYPTDYVEGTRYPLIVQTHGLRPNEFILDGPSAEAGTAYAARALAASGFLVLQVRDNLAATADDSREAERYAEGYSAAVENLAQRGLVDDTRVGLVAFSRTGLHAIQLLASRPKLLAAVDISDGCWWGYWHNLLMTNYPFAAEVRNLTGGQPSQADSIQHWIDANPLYKISNARAAVRLEANGQGTAICFWETFSLLRNASHPVEFAYYPQGSHVLMKPLERLHSQGGNVDWFRFWLRDYEDPDPAKTQQYQRWRAMRVKQCELFKDDNAPWYCRNQRPT